jgi:hypothetical protein
MFNKDVIHVLLCCSLKAQIVGFQQPTVKNSLSYTQTHTYGIKENCTKHIYHDF